MHVITLDGIIPVVNECLISGYGDNGAVLLGYNPFMYIPGAHKAFETHL